MKILDIFSAFSHSTVGYGRSLTQEPIYRPNKDISTAANIIFGIGGVDDEWNKSTAAALT